MKNSPLSLHLLSEAVMWFGSEVKWGKFYDFILCQMTSRKFGDIKSFGVSLMWAQERQPYA